MSTCRTSSVRSRRSKVTCAVPAVRATMAIENENALAIAPGAATRDSTCAVQSMPSHERPSTLLGFGSTGVKQLGPLQEPPSEQTGLPINASDTVTSHG